MLTHYVSSPRRRADLTLLSFLAMGGGVALLTGLLSGSLGLALLVGVAPGVILGALAWFRIRRGRCGGCQFCPMRKPGSCGMPAE